jgi:hypothetical protein
VCYAPGADIFLDEIKENGICQYWTRLWLFLNDLDIFYTFSKTLTKLSG